LKPKDDEAVYKEINVMRELSSHSGVIKLYHFFENVNTFHMVLELAKGGDVFSRLSKRSFYPENDARKLARNLLTTIEFIHSKGYVHRDLKPENLLLETLNEDSNGLKIADFGFARKDNGGALKTRCGTPSFVAPEICVGVPYDKSVDMWSCGVILFLLLGGYPPFQDKDMMKLFRKIRAADYSFLEKYWDPVSTPAKQLIVRMLTVDPSKRITAGEALKSKWISASEEDLDTATNVHLSDTVAQLKKFIAKQKLRGAIIAMSYATTAKFWTANTVSFMSKQTTFTSMPGSIASSKNMRTSLTAGKALKNFDSLYQCQYKIRGGRIAEVWQGCKRDPDQKTPLAIKIVQKKDMDLREEGRVMNEVAILQSLSHANILAVHDFFEEAPAFYIVMELMKGGDVFDRIVAKSQYTEKDARLMAHSLLSAVDYFHGRGIAHRDLKPQNLLLEVSINVGIFIQSCFNSHIIHFFSFSAG
jgi:serine/threonine protein kinase